MTEKKFAPLVGPWTEKANIDDTGCLSATFHMQGLAADLASAEQIMATHAAYNHTAMQLGHHSVEWYQHFTRAERSGMTPLPPCPGWFAQRFDAAYTECLGGSLFQNDLWFTIVKHPPAGIKAGLRYVYDTMRDLMSAGKPLAAIKIPRAEQTFLDDFEELAARTQGAFSALRPRRLMLEERNGQWYSQADEASHLIMNNFFQQMPVTAGRSSYKITPYRLDIGEDAICIHTGPVSKRFVILYGLKNYPIGSNPRMFDALRAAPFGFSLTNSFAFSRSSGMLTSLGRKYKMMISSNDSASDDVKVIKQAENNLASGYNVWGRHQCTIAVHARGSIESLDRAAVRCEDILSASQLAAVRETKAPKAAYYSQLHGNRRWRTRPNPIPSECFCDFAALHSLPTARAEGRWGPAILNLRSTADTEIPFHAQVQDSPTIPKEDLGSMLIVGPSGSGKTGLEGSLATLIQRQGARVVVVDKDFGLAPMVHANGGPYLVLRNGVPTGLAPLRAMQDTPNHRSQVTKLVRMLIMSDGQGEMSSDEDTNLNRAIEIQMQMPPEQREMAGIAVALGMRDRAGARARLRKWCWGERLGWAVDCRKDELDLSAQMMGFETSDLLKNPEVCGPILNTIFHRTDSLIDGTPIAFIVDEMWAADQNDDFSDDTNDKLATIRKREGIVILATQNARTVMASRHSHTYKQQVPTKIFFADGEASHADLVDGLGLTEAEFHAVTVTLATRRHQFLVKRPGGSFIARFDMSRRPDAIAVISGRASTYELMLRLKDEYGAAPEQWVPHFERLAPGIVDKPVIKKLELVA